MYLAIASAIPVAAIKIDAILNLSSIFLFLASIACLLTSIVWLRSRR